VGFDNINEFNWHIILLGFLPFLQQISQKRMTLNPTGTEREGKRGN